MLPSATNDSVGTPIAAFRSSIPSPPVPLFTLPPAPHSASRKTRGRVDRYSFLVRLFHPLLHAGFIPALHLLLLHKPAAHHLIDRRLYIRRADRRRPRLKPSRLLPGQVGLLL